MTDRVIPTRPVKEHIDNTQALKDSGLKIVHVHNEFGPYRSLTIAYQRINKSHYKIATAVTHRADTFEKKVGTKVALANFAKGNTIVVPADSRATPSDQFFNMFGDIRA